MSRPTPVSDTSLPSAPAALSEADPYPLRAAGEFPSTVRVIAGLTPVDRLFPTWHEAALTGFGV